MSSFGSLPPELVEEILLYLGDYQKLDLLWASPVLYRMNYSNRIKLHLRTVKYWPMNWHPWSLFYRVKINLELYFMYLGRYTITKNIIGLSGDMLDVERYPPPEWIEEFSMRIYTFNGGWPVFINKDRLSLIKLQIRGYSGVIHDNYLPAGLKYLELETIQCIFCRLPNTLKILRAVCIVCNIDHLPDGLEELSVDILIGNFPKYLPQNLKKLYIGKSHEQIPNYWPDGLISIRIINLCDQRIPNGWPSKLESLELYNFNGRLPKSWPQGIRSIKMPHFNGDLPEVWPDSLLEINIPSFNGKLPAIWPKKLQKLNIASYIGKIPDLPTSIEEYTINTTYDVPDIINDE